MSRMTRPSLAKGLASFALAFAMALPNSVTADPASDLQALADKIALQPDTAAGSADPALLGLAPDPAATASDTAFDRGTSITGTPGPAASTWRFPANATELADYARQSLANGDTRPPVRNDACDFLARLAPQPTTGVNPAEDKTTGTAFRDLCKATAE